MKRFCIVVIIGLSLFGSLSLVADEMQEAYTKATEEKETTKAIQLYNEFLRTYPQSKFADDALYQIALVRHEAFHDAEKAKRALEALLERYPKSDMAPKANEFLKKLKPTKKESPPVASWGRSSKGELLDLIIDTSQDATVVTLVFDREALFTTDRVPYGERTKSPPELLLDFSQMKQGKHISKSYDVGSASLQKIVVKSRWLDGGVGVRFQMPPRTIHRVEHKGTRVVVRLSKKESPVVVPSEKKQITIVVDPGHGGEDTGAIGKKKAKEKDVALAISKKVAEELRSSLGANVLLTRSDDRTLTLEERDAIAVQHKADLFLSIHANASTDSNLSGIQTYYLNNASDDAARRLAQRENKGAGKPLSEVGHILSTMMQNADTEESRLLATDVQKEMVERLSKQYPDVRDLNVQSALFYVLVGPKCPGILVETSFISNPVEEKRLATSAYQADLAKAIGSGVKKYLETRERRLSSL